MSKPAICTACRGTGQWEISTVTGSRTRKKDCPVCTGFGVQNVAWVTDRGIDHVIIATLHGDTFTGCNRWGHYFGGGIGVREPQSRVEHFEPKRRCKKCVARVKEGRPWREGPEGWPVEIPKSEAA